jgi:hypothetical protein
VDRVVHRAGGCLDRGHGRLGPVLAAHVHHPSHGRPFAQAIGSGSGCRRAGRLRAVGCAIGWGVDCLRSLARIVACGGRLARGSGRVAARYLTLRCGVLGVGDDGVVTGGSYRSLCSCNWVPRDMTLARKLLNKEGASEVSIADACPGVSTHAPSLLQALLALM